MQREDFVMYLNEEEMKFAVVYAVKQYKAPISESLIFEIFTWDKEIMEYFDLAAAVGELIEDGYIIKKFYRNEESLCLSESGEAAFIYFKSRIPFSVRERIDTAIGRVKYDEIVDPNAARADVVFFAEEQYMAKCSLIEDNVPLMELSLNMGSRVYAERVAKFFKKNSKKIYEEILKICTDEKN